MSEGYEPKPLELNAPVIVPLTPLYGVNYTDGNNKGCYLEIYNKLMIVHIAIKNISVQAYREMSLLDIPSSYIIRDRAYTVGGWGDNGMELCLITLDASSVNRVKAYKQDGSVPFTGYMTGTLVCTLQ